MSIGYAIGRVRVKGVGLGSAGILLTALVFGHFGYEISSIVQNIGLACFVAAVGMIAGPTFFRNFRGKARSFVLIGTVIIVSGCLTCLLVIRVTDITTDLGLGLLSGALTTTPGLAAAIEATGSDMVSVGYGIAYPFGVISVVLFVQIIPRLLHVDLDAERDELKSMGAGRTRLMPENLIRFDTYGLFSFSLVIVLGFLAGQIKIPFPWGGSFSLGTSGGPLLTGIVHLAALNFSRRHRNQLKGRELGLAFFLVGAGTHAGKGFAEVLSQKGMILFVYGALMAVVPLAVGLAAARKICRLNILESMGAICGGMTSTPALGTLISSTGTDDVAHSYAATYPVALALIVVLAELIGANL